MPDEVPCQAFEEPLSVRVLQYRTEPVCLDRVHDLIAQVWEDAPDIPPEHRMCFEIAVVEITANIVRHAFGARDDQVDLELRLALFQDRVEAQFRDTGAAAVADVVETAHMPDELADEGRGLAIALAAVDQVTYRRDGDVNRWLVVMRRA